MRNTSLKVSFFFILTSVFCSCSRFESASSGITSKTLNECVLSVDTFSFKGIRIGDSVDHIKKLYQLKKTSHNEYSIHGDSIVSYSVTSSNDLTLFYSKITSLSVRSYEDIIFQIDIYFEQSGISLNNSVTDLIYDLSQKFTGNNCVISEAESPATIRGKRLYLKNSALSILATSGVEINPFKIETDNDRRPFQFLKINVVDVKVKQRLFNILLKKRKTKRKKEDDF